MDKVAGAVEEASKRKKILSQFGSELTVAGLETLARGQDVRDLGLCSDLDSITRAEFALYMLSKLKRVEAEELRAIQQVFDMYDVDKSGTLTEADITLAAAKPRNEPSHETGPKEKQLSLKDVFFSDLSACKAK